MTDVQNLQQTCLCGAYSGLPNIEIRCSKLYPHHFISIMWHQCMVPF